MTSVHELSAKTIDGEDQPLSDYADKVMVIVNVASKCGFTPQYKGLEALYQEYKDDGLVILGFPCNQFGAQEPGDEQAIATFCSVNYGVTFPMFSKIEVNGPNAAPLFEHLKKSKPGLAGSKNVKWNFTKFLVDKSGKVVRRFGPQERPATMKYQIKKLLSK